MKRLVVLLAFLALVPCLVDAESKGLDQEREEQWNRVVKIWPDNPFWALEILDKLKLDPRTLREKMGTIRARDAYSICLIAEIKKRLGDPRVEDEYKTAISKGAKEPLFELLFGDYYRTIRGPKKPLFPEAEEHYYNALEKLNELAHPPGSQNWDDKTKERYNHIRRRLDRALMDLYQEDGIPFCTGRFGAAPIKDQTKPRLFFATVNQYGLTTTDPDRVDDARSFTSEALFAQSASRLNRLLTRDELDKIARTKELFENYDRLRLRHDYLPVVDFFYRYRHIDDAQITNFFQPTQFNNFHLNEYGIAMEKPFNFYPAFDAFVRGTYSRIAREGLIEFLPNKVEDINQFQVEGAISTNFLGSLGPDKLVLNVKYAYQDINQDIPNPPQRDRNIFSSTLTYQLSRPIANLPYFYGSPFGDKGTDLFVGYARDVESFGGVDVRKQDIFGGVSVKGIGPFGCFGPFDITLQPAYFTGDVEGDSSQNMSMYRTNFTFLYRIWDEDKFVEYPPPDPKDDPGSFASKYSFLGFYPAFFHFVIPFRHDVSVDGPSYFENFRVGAQLAWKLINVDLGRATFLLSVGYDFQRFYNIDRDVHLFGLNLSIGF